MNSLVLGVAILVGAPGLKDPPKKDPAIVGEWIVESMVVGGNGPVIAPNGKMWYQITSDGKWVPRRPDGANTGGERHYSVDPKADPPAIDIDIPPKADGAQLRPSLGIWKVVGDTLTICFANSGDERPKAFEATGPRTVVMVLKRAKRDAANPPKK